MSCDADLINAYRDQLARIRAAFEAFEASPFDKSDEPDSLICLRDAINSTEADDIENLYKPQVSTEGWLKPKLHSVFETPEHFYVWTLDDEDETPRDEER
jgi:hypothetical protein